MPSFRAMVVATTVSALLLAACAAPEAETGPVEPGTESDVDGAAAPSAGAVDEAAAPDDEAVADTIDEPALSVVATVAPLAELVRAVGGERVEVSPLVPSGADAHTYEPRPRDVVVLSEADAYVGVGLDLNEGALRLARENLPEGAALVLLGEDALTDRDLVFDHAHDDHTHDHDDTHAHDDHTHDHDDTHDHDHDHDHDHGHDDRSDRGGEGLGPNPHVWISLRNAVSLVDGIMRALTDLDPEGAEHYETNATGFQDELAALDGRVAAAVETIPAQHRMLVTYHDAWSYFARDHGLVFATALQPADFSEPSAGELRALIDLIRELEAPAVFGSEVFPTPVLEAIAEETDARYVGELSDDMLPGSPGDPEHTYLELMRRNAYAIVEGLGGDASGLR